MATGVGVAGLLGVGGLCAENQGYQQGTESQQSVSGAQTGQSGQTYQVPSGQQGQQGTQREQGEMGQSRMGRSESTSQEQGQSYESGKKQTASRSQSEAMRGEKEHRGTVRSVDTSSQTLTLRGPRMRNREIAWSDKTEVLRNGKAVSPDALQKGERVRITYRNENGRNIASQIVIGEGRREARRASRHAHQGY